MCGLLGVGLPMLSACKSQLKVKTLSRSDKVIVVGAGAAGLSAAHLLNQRGIQVEVLEASSVYGGRMKRTNEFADFPIPTGAEWLHAKKNVLDEIVNDSDVRIDIITKPYDFEVDYALVDGEKRNLKELGFSIDQKFIGSTWFDFFERYIVPEIESKIRFNEVVQSVDYATDKVVLETNDTTYRADKIIITVPVQLLKQSSLRFTPALPQAKSRAIEKVLVWGGCKAFIKFSKRFYPAVTGFETKPESAGHKLYYDASYGQDTSENVLGLFAVGPIAEPYLTRKQPQLIEYVLAELDALFGGQASPNYKAHIFQNWTQEPFAKGAYVHYFEDWRTIRALGKPVANKLYFAGDAYTDGNDWSSVHAAARSAKRVVEQL